MEQCNADGNIFPHKHQEHSVSAQNNQTRSMIPCRKCTRWCRFNIYLVQYPFRTYICIHLYPYGVYIRLDYAYLPTSCRRRIFILPHGLAVLDLGSVRQIHDRATMAGVNDTVQDDSLWKWVHQPVVQLIIDNLSSLQAN